MCIYILESACALKRALDSRFLERIAYWHRASQVFSTNHQ